MRTGDLPRPKLVAPAGACDSQVHVYDPAVPVIPGAVMPAPGWATLKAYEAVSRRLGMARAVFVQPTVYGIDNTVLLDAIARFDGVARGVAVVGPQVTKDELAELTASGIRGARFQMLGSGVLPWEALEPVAEKVAPFGWHIVLQMDGRLLAEREERIAKLPCRVVIDHCGKFLEPVATDHPGFCSLLRLLDNGRTWLKLCGAYETSKAGPPLYPDVGRLAKTAARRAPDRMIWAANWPHVAVSGELPDDAMQLDLVLDWIPDERARIAALVDNPAELYAFGPVTR